MTASCKVFVFLLMAFAFFASILGMTPSSAFAQQKPTPSAITTSQPQLHAETLKRLREFVAIVRPKDTENEVVLKALDELNRQLKDEHLATLESFAVTEEAKIAAWALARILVERKRYDGAADVFVTRLAAEKGDRQYRMWKWWEYNFREEKNYEELSRQITDALLRQFDKGSPDRKQAIAEVFGKGAAEAKLTAKEFKQVIGYDTKE